MIPIKSALAMLLWGGRSNTPSSGLEASLRPLHIDSNWRDQSLCSKGGYLGESDDKDLDNGQKMVDEDNTDDDLLPTNLRLVIIISGKRKTGKDHISTLITNYVGFSYISHVAVLRISGPIKRQFAKSNILDFERLLDASSYKEQYRLLMVEWSENFREKVGWHCFLRTAIKEQRAKHKSIWIITDARRVCDIEYFEDDPIFSSVKIIKIRVQATEEARQARGWTYDERIDLRPTECGLDDYNDWTYIVNNDDYYDKELLHATLKPIYSIVDETLDSLNKEQYGDEMGNDGHASAPPE